MRSTFLPNLAFARRRENGLTVWFLRGIPAAFIIVLASLLYTRTLQPTLGGMYNSEEYQQAAYSLSLAHSTGYPLYLMLGKIWVTILPFADVAYRMNLFSAFWAVAAAALTYFITLEISHSRLSSLLAGIAFATNETVWRYASVAEVDTFTGFLAALVVLTLLLWKQKRLPLAGCTFAYGLALVHHRTSALYLPAILIFVFMNDPKLFRSPKDLAVAAAAAVIPLLAYLYVPLRAFTSPDYFQDPASMLAYIIGNQTAGNTEFVTDLNGWLGRIDQIYRYYLWNWFTPFGIAAAAVGFLGSRFKKLSSIDDGSTSLLLFLPFAIVSSFTLLTTAGDIDRYLVFPVLLLSIEVGVGAERVGRLIAERFGYLRFSSLAHYGVIVALFAIPAQALSTNIPKVDFSQNKRVYSFWDEVLNLPIEPNASIVGNWSEVNALRYFQRVEGRRSDLKVVPSAGDSDLITNLIRPLLATNQVVYLTPGDAAPNAEWHYSALGPLLRVTSESDRRPPNPPVAAVQELAPLEFLGYGLNVALAPGVPSAQITIAPPRLARVTLFWRVASAPTGDVMVRLRLADETGRPLAQVVEPPLRGLYPPRLWQKGEFLTDVHGISVPEGTPPGAYKLQLALIDQQTGHVIDASQWLDGVNVSKPDTPAPQLIFLREHVSFVFGSLELIGYNGTAIVHRRGPLEFSLGWTAREDIKSDLCLSFQLVDKAGRKWAEQQVPVDSRYKTSAWLKSDSFREYYTILLPADAPAGDSELRVTVLDTHGIPISASSNVAETAVKVFSFSIAP